MLHHARTAALVGGLAMGLGIGLSASGDQTQHTVEVRPVGLQVNHLPEDVPDDAARVNEGTRVTVLLEAETIIANLDRNASEVDLFMDDTGTDLLVEREGQGRISQVGFFRQRGDERFGTVELRAPGVPSADARRVILSGELVVDVAEEVITRTFDEVTVAGDELELGDEKISVSRSRDEDRDRTTVHLSMPRELGDRISSIELLDEDGESVRTRGGGTTRGAEFERRIYLDEDPEHLTVELEVYEKLVEVRVPFEVDAGLGLAPRQWGVAARED